LPALPAAACVGAAFPMNIIAKLFTSSLGKKFIMAITGAALFFFVVGHLVGNLQFFAGKESINAYGEFLHSKPGLIWSARLGLLAMVVLHIWSAVKISAENKAARPVEYAEWKPTAASYASRTMLMSGLIIFFFILYHLLHFTVQAKVVNLTGEDFFKFKDMLGRPDVHRMMVTGFKQPVVSIFYLAALGLLCLHLSHGVSAMFQSLGLKNKVYGPAIDKFAMVAAGVIFLGYASIPLAVLLNLVK
jgi:succinate dehydrogenase / fumarate reductase cytochrome b subunit